MVGSKRYFEYTSDSGSKYAVQLDESNTRAVGGGANLYSDSGTSSAIGLPKNIVARYVEYVSADTFTTRRCYCMTLAQYNAAPPTIEDAVSGLTLTLRRKRGEKIRVPYGVDTGQTDGTQP